MRILCCLLILTLAGCGSKSETGAKAGIPLSIKSPEAAKEKTEAAPKPTKEQAAAVGNPGVETLVKKARAAVVLGQPVVAVEALSQAIGLSPDEARLFRLRGDVYALLGQDANAKVDFSLAIRLEPKNANLRNVRGYFLMSHGLTDEALADFEQATQLDPAMSTAWNNMGLVSLARKEFKTAEQRFTKALDNDTDYVDALNNRGFVRFKQQKYKTALTDLNQAVKLNGDYASAWNNIGLVHMAQQNYEAAIKAFDQTVRLAPMDSRWLGHRRAALLKLEKFEAAAADAERIRWLANLDVLTRESMQHSEKAENWIRRARYLVKGSEFGAAVQDYSRALAVSPGNTEALNGRAFALLNIGEFQKAIADCDESLVSQETVEAYSVRADAWMGLENFAQAVSDYEAAQRFDEKIATAYRSYADQLRKDGENEQAAEIEARLKAITDGLNGVSTESNSEPLPFPEITR
ncbi:MAG: tetratricopeptide repeat protein [Planctomycetaceae bacterium]|nr:tetratricopeptide repeat protein [Planctomycetaceae bacterium]